MRDADLVFDAARHFAAAGGRRGQVAQRQEQNVVLHIRFRPDANLCTGVGAQDGITRDKNILAQRDFAKAFGPRADETGVDRDLDRVLECDGRVGFTLVVIRSGEA